METTNPAIPHTHLLKEEPTFTDYFASLGMQVAAIMLSTTCHKLSPPEKESANYKKGFAECKKRILFALQKMEKEAEENAAVLGNKTL